MDFNNFQLKNKLNMKKLILLIIGFIIFMIMYIIFQARTLFDKTNNILLLLSLISDSIFMTLLMGFMVISILPIIILRKKDEVSLTSKHMPIIVWIILIIFLFNLNYTAIRPYKKYTIDSKKIYGIEMTFRALGDIINNKTIEIKTNNWKIIHDRRLTRRHTIYDYYLEINEGEYIIPIGNANKVRALLYQNSYGEKSTNTITVYKNSNIIKEINGVDLSAKDNEIYEFANMKQYKINIVLQAAQTISYQTIGCTVDEFISNEDVCLSIFDKNDKAVFVKTIKESTDELPVHLDDGKYYAYICTHIMNLEKISNGIVYEIKDGKIYKAEKQD
jgi:hypothetical protein